MILGRRVLQLGRKPTKTLGGLALTDFITPKIIALTAISREDRLGAVDTLADSPQDLGEIVLKSTCSETRKAAFDLLVKDFSSISLVAGDPVFGDDTNAALFGESSEKTDVLKRIAEESTYSEDRLRVVAVFSNDIFVLCDLARSVNQDVRLAAFDLLKKEVRTLVLIFEESEHEDVKKAAIQELSAKVGHLSPTNSNELDALKYVAMFSDDTVVREAAVSRLASYITQLEGSAVAGGRITENIRKKTIEAANALKDIAFNSRYNDTKISAMVALRKLSQDQQLS